MPNNSDVYGNQLDGNSYRNDFDDSTRLVNNTKLNDKKSNKNYLDELNREGYRLIKWSNELANLNTYSQEQTQQKFNLSSVPPLNNLNNSQQLQQNYGAVGNSFDNFNYYRKENVEKEELLGVIKVLYNNYNNLLKKYYELSEQNNSYLEGIREYQHKLDNSNYVIQLLNSTHSNYNNLNNSQQQQEDNNNLRVQQEYLLNQQLQNKEKEDELNRKLDEVNDKLKLLEEKEHQLNKKSNELDALLQEENNKLEELKKKELSVLLTQKSVSTERENSLVSQYQQNDESEKHEQLLQQLLETNRNNGENNKDYLEEYKKKETQLQQMNSVEQMEEDDQLLLLNNINTDIINSIYIKTLNDNNSGMYVLKKGFFNRLKTKNCKLVVNDNTLCLFVRRRLTNQFEIKNLSRLEFGPDSICYKLYYKSLSHKWHYSDCYFTIYAYDKRCFNIICDSKETVSIWFNSLNSLLYSLNGPYLNNPTTDKLDNLSKLNPQQLSRQDTSDNINVMEYLNEFNKLSLFSYYTDSLYNNVFNVIT